MNQILDHYQKIYKQEVIDDDCEKHMKILSFQSNTPKPKN